MSAASGPLASIKVIGVGGGGSNAITRMMDAEIEGIEFFSVNTDRQALERTKATRKVQIGEKITRGRGTGGNPSIGAKAAEESSEVLYNLLRDTEMVFVTAGMGGGTGTGAAPIIAQIAREVGALTVAVVTKPFTFEGAWRRNIAEEGLMHLKDKVDTLISIPNDRILQVVGEQTTLESAFRVVDEVLYQGIRGIAELVTQSGTINLDFADVKTIMTQGGASLMAIGRGQGENRAQEAAESAVSSPLLEMTIDGAKGVLFNVTGGPDMTLAEVNRAAAIITNSVDPQAKIIFGAVIDPTMENEIKITVVATGFDGRKAATATSRPSVTTSTTPVTPTMPSTTPQQDSGRVNIYESDDADLPAFLRRR
ncbi:MAG: cell division protein FtsZ [Bacteroidetes bacterium]|nr:cell division protein FtsZ [Bacteroidota bacterium]